MPITTKTVYVASDGTQFTDEAEATAHEAVNELANALGPDDWLFVDLRQLYIQGWRFIPPQPQPADDGWITWTGGECPVPADTLVEVKFRIGGDTCLNRAGAYRWSHTNSYGDIIAYRVL